MMKKVMIGALGLMLVLAAIAVAQMERGHGMMGKHGGPGMAGMKGCCQQGMGECGGPGMEAECGPGMMRGGGMGLPRLMEMADKLELTQAQRDKIKGMMEAFQLERVDKQAALKKAEIKLKGLMHDDKAAEADVIKGIDQIAGLKADMAKMRYHHLSEMRSILTDKQREMLKSMKMESRKEVRVRVIEKRGGEEEDDETPAPHPGGKGM